MHERWDTNIWQRQQTWSRRVGRFLTIEQLSALSGASTSVLRRIARLELIERTWIEGQPMYHVEYLSLVRKILRLRYDLGVSWSSMDLVLQLLDHIEALERQIDGRHGQDRYPQ